MITSTHNPRIAAVRKLRRTKERRATGFTTIEGPFLLEEAIAGSAVITEVFATPDDDNAALLCAGASLDLTTVTSGILRSLAGSMSPRGPVAVIEIPPSSRLEKIDTIVMWDVSDPGNAGTIVRTAAALGFQVAVTEGCVDLWSSKVVRAAVGGHFRAKLVTDIGTDPIELHNAGLQPMVAVAGAANAAENSMAGSEPVALIVGNEARGVPEPVASAAGVASVALAMPGGSESLNAAVAAGILMYLRVLQR